MFKLLKPYNSLKELISKTYFNVFKNDNQENFKILTQWEKNAVCFYLNDKENLFYYEKVLYDKFRKFAEKFNLSLEEYLSELQLIFSSHDQSYIFELSKCQFQIKKIIVPEDDIYKQFCVVNLQQLEDNERQLNYWNEILVLLEFYKNKIDTLSENYNDLKEEKEKIKQDLDQFEKKSRRETNLLMQKFVLILNEKKDRIQELQDLLSDSSSYHCIEHDTAEKNVKKSDALIVEPVNSEIDYGDSNDSNKYFNLWENDQADNETLVTNNTNQSIIKKSSPLKRLSSDEPQPSTSKITANESEDDQDLLSGLDEVPVIKMKRFKNVQEIDEVQNTTHSIKLINGNLEEKREKEEVTDVKNKSKRNAKKLNLNEYLSKIK